MVMERERHQIKKEQITEGFQTLRGDGRDKIRLGLHPDEVLRVTAGR